LAHRDPFNTQHKQSRGSAYGVFVAVIFVTAGVSLALLFKDSSRASTAASVPSPAGQSATGRVCEFLRLPEAERVKKLGRIVTRTGDQCDATDALYKGMDHDGSAYFAVTCSDADSWMVTLVNNADGNNLVTNCETMAEVGNDCFEVWE
jgi:hypothetical protein